MLKSFSPSILKKLGVGQKFSELTYANICGFKFFNYKKENTRLKFDLGINRTEQFYQKLNTVTPDVSVKPCN